MLQLERHFLLLDYTRISIPNSTECPAIFWDIERTLDDKYPTVLEWTVDSSDPKFYLDVGKRPIQCRPDFLGH